MFFYFSFIYPVTWATCSILLTKGVYVELYVFNLFLGFQRWAHVNKYYKLSCPEFWGYKHEYVHLSSWFGVVQYTHTYSGPDFLHGYQ